jgi:hypothetical protein
MSPEDTNRIGFAYPGTVETIPHLKILADYCASLPVLRKCEIQELYSREFSLGYSFTFIQQEEDAIDPPMDWMKCGEDDAGTFTIYGPTEDENPYNWHKIGRLTRDGKTYVFHLFYGQSKRDTGLKVLMEIMIKLKMVGLLVLLDHPESAELA